MWCQADAALENSPYTREATGAKRRSPRLRGDSPYTREVTVARGPHTACGASGPDAREVTGPGTVVPDPNIVRPRRGR